MFGGSVGARLLVYEIGMKCNVKAMLMTLISVQVMSVSTGYAQSPDVAAEPVKIRENFSPFELGTIGVGTAGAVFLIGFGEHVFGHPNPSM